MSVIEKLFIWWGIDVGAVTQAVRSHANFMVSPFFVGVKAHSFEVKSMNRRGLL